MFDIATEILIFISIAAIAVITGYYLGYYFGKRDYEYEIFADQQKKQMEEIRDRKLLALFREEMTAMLRMNFQQENKK